MKGRRKLDTTIELIPLTGAVIGEHRVNFGDEKAAVLRTFKIAKEEDETLYLDDYELEISFDQSNRVSFIESVHGAKAAALRPRIGQCAFFQQPAVEVLAFLNELNQSEGCFNEDTGYSFSTISAGCYRPSTPEEIEAEIDLMKQEGSYEENRDWLDEDLSLAHYFETVGIGVEGYYR